ncbi:hypothetical protein C8N35_104214 [Breoghania corrubedonensis]|uniref:Uncharacterized protein n=1 Tax=Breoghania corrubedonensis TaxID=665038 RepID=A0A2T5VA06_9HYPH|nr:hypothetical protein [Breoghania corrubedonensis]PTW60589.1 hypothetical protein C8N35_104214 [Breoghania corrubedonensis]
MSELDSHVAERYSEFVAHMTREFERDGKDFLAYLLSLAQLEIENAYELGRSHKGMESRKRASGSVSMPHSDKK